MDGLGFDGEKVLVTHQAASSRPLHEALRSITSLTGILLLEMVHSVSDRGRVDSAIARNTSESRLRTPSRHGPCEFLWNLLSWLELLGWDPSVSLDTLRRHGGDDLHRTGEFLVSKSSLFRIACPR
jgi:hypothetical protein